MLHAVIHRHHIHALNRDVVDAVGSGFRAKVMGHCRAAFNRGTHGIPIVLDDENHRKIKQAGQVHGFVEGPLVDRTITEEAKRDFVTLAAANDFVFVFRGECETGTKWRLGTDNAVPAVHGVGRIEEVH